MSKVENFPELNEFFEGLSDAGFDLSPKTIYNVFDEDCDVDHPELDWRDAGSLFNRVYAEFGVEQVEGQYGGEGEGEYCYEIIKVKDKYYRASWSYYSYQGCEYDWIEDTIQEVKPVEKTIIVYEAI